MNIIDIYPTAEVFYKYKKINIYLKKYIEYFKNDKNKKHIQNIFRCYNYIINLDYFCGYKKYFKNISYYIKELNGFKFLFKDLETFLDNFSIYYEFYINNCYESFNGENFEQYFWEIYLFNELNKKYNLNLQRECGEGKPDFYIQKKEYKIWIEAVLPKFETNEQQNQDDRLRLTNAISCKIRKIEIYKNKGIIKDNDKIILAINDSLLFDNSFSAHCNINDICEMPKICGILYKMKGNSISYNSSNGKNIIFNVEDDVELKKENGKSVPNNWFLNDLSNNIDGIIYSSNNFLEFNNIEFIKNNISLSKLADINSKIFFVYIKNRNKTIIEDFFKLGSFVFYKNKNLYRCNDKDFLINLNDNLKFDDKIENKTESTVKKEVFEELKIKVV